MAHRKPTSFYNEILGEMLLPDTEDVDMEEKKAEIGDTTNTLSHKKSRRQPPSFSLHADTRASSLSTQKQTPTTSEAADRMEIMSYLRTPLNTFKSLLMKRDKAEDNRVKLQLQKSYARIPKALHLPSVQLPASSKLREQSEQLRKDYEIAQTTVLFDEATDNLRQVEQDLADFSDKLLDKFRERTRNDDQQTSKYLLSGSSTHSTYDNLVEQFKTILNQEIMRIVRQHRDTRVSLLEKQARTATKKAEQQERDTDSPKGNIQQLVAQEVEKRMKQLSSNRRPSTKKKNNNSPSSRASTNKKPKNGQSPKPKQPPGKGKGKDSGNQSRKKQGSTNGPRNQSKNSRKK